MDCFVGRIYLDEPFDAQGLKDARNDLEALESRDEKERERKVWLGKYIDRVNSTYEKVPDDEGRRWMRKVKYIQRCDSKGQPAGRHTTKNVAFGPVYEDGEKSSICLTGMLRELRGYAVGPSSKSCPSQRRRLRGHAHDLDFKCCQPTILAQLPGLLTWTDGRDPPSVKELRYLCSNRPRLYKELAENHQLDSDEMHYDGYQKDMLKKLTTSLLFSGKYSSWIHRYTPNVTKRHLMIDALEYELKLLSKAIFESVEWAPFVAEWRIVLKEEKNGDKEAIDRSIMARIAQDYETKCLLAMKAQLEEDGWTLLSLVYDGAIVRHREGHSFDMAKLQNRVFRETKLLMVIEEKPLFGAEPALTLRRDFGLSVPE